METSVVRLIPDYLTNRKQQAEFKCHCTFKLFKKVLRSILGPSVFILQLCDLFLLTGRIKLTIYADNTILYNYGRGLSVMDFHLRKGNISVDVSFQWFSANHMKANKGNSYCYYSAYEKKNMNLQVFFSYLNSYNSSERMVFIIGCLA